MMWIASAHKSTSAHRVRELREKQYEARKPIKEDSEPADRPYQNSRPRRFVIGPDGFIYLSETTSADFDKRFFRRS